MSFPVHLPKAKHTATLIFLHGLGDTGHGWMQQLSEIVQPHVKVLCPNAPHSPVTLNGGMVMPSWFDIKSLDFRSDEDEAGIQKSSALVQSLIDEEIKAGIASENIVVGGFSQGGSVALHTLQTIDKKLGGFIGLSTFLCLHTKFGGLCKSVNKSTRLFLGHGNADMVVNYMFGEMTRDVLKSFYSDVTFNTYNNMGHSSCGKEMSDVKKFLEKAIPK